MLYSRPQLSLLLLLAAALLAGFAVREWRAGFPEAATRVEAFDRPEGPATPGAVPLATPPSPSRPPPSAAPPAAPRRAPRAERAALEGAPSDPRPLDLNEATAEQLARLPGVGPGLARRIVEERERRGRFTGPEGLRAVLGMGPRKLAALRDLVSVAP
jgi:competence ComEA-like helix-hairpin-helix protein